eukprot:1970873-Pyramimonas_sp.AAC.1
MVQEWFKSGSRMVREWFRDGPELVQKGRPSDQVRGSRRRGSKVFQKWFTSGSKSGSKVVQG